MSLLRLPQRLGRPLRILAIETSCDDTAVSIVDGEKRILSDQNFHQHAIHAATQGIVPSLAASEHKRILPLAIDAALNQARMDITNIDVFAATRGPGIAGCLSVGFEAGRLLAAVCKKPFFAVHHMVQFCGDY